MTDDREGIERLKGGVRSSCYGVAAITALNMWNK